MHPLIAEYERKQIETLTESKTIPEFRPGDTVNLTIKVTDTQGATLRLQHYQGVVIAKRNRGVRTSFTVRRTTSAATVERSFLIYSPKIEKIELISRGKVRRAKLYYLRDRKGKAARIKQRITTKTPKITSTK